MLSVPRGQKKNPENLGPGRARAMMSFTQGVRPQPTWGEDPAVARLPGKLLCRETRASDRLGLQVTEHLHEYLCLT